MSDEKKELKIVTGSGKDLDISPVYNHIKINNPASRKNKKAIVIPKSNKEEKKIKR